MRSKILVFFCLLQAPCIFANISFIQISKVSNEPQHIKAYNYVKDNKHFYDHWIEKWTYTKSKQELILNLKDNYKLFASLDNKNAELNLLLGDISHYLYNLEDTVSYSKAIMHYNQARSADPKDFRALWFLGFHYALANIPDQAITHFLAAEKLLPANQPAEFWNDYAWTAAVTNMPSRCIYAMDKVKQISGKVGSFESQLGPSIRKRIERVDKAKAYRKEDIWTVRKGKFVTFTSRPLGIKLWVDSNWTLSISDFQKQGSVLMMNPLTIKGKQGQDIDYTIVVMMKAASDTDNFDRYIQSFIKKYPGKRKIPISGKYNKMMAYEVIDSSIYPEMGGGHLHIIGVERNAPAYPGLLLEIPQDLPNGDSGKVNYYRATNSKGRFKGKIFYAFLLDTCEDIHEQSLAVFKAFIEEQVVLE